MRIFTQGGCNLPTSCRGGGGAGGYKGGEEGWVGGEMGRRGVKVEVLGFNGVSTSCSSLSDPNPETDLNFFDALPDSQGANMKRAILC